MKSKIKFYYTQNTSERERPPSRYIPSNNMNHWGWPLKNVLDTDQKIIKKNNWKCNDLSTVHRLLFIYQYLNSSLECSKYPGSIVQFETVCRVISKWEHAPYLWPDTRNSLQHCQHSDTQGDTDINKCFTNLSVYSMINDIIRRMSMK